MQTELQKAERELKILNYSQKTIKSYLYGLREYFAYKKSGFEKYDIENVKNFLLLCESRNTPQFHSWLYRY